MTEPAVDRSPEESGNAWKRSAWKIPSTGGQEVPVMGANSWPALSKASSSKSSKGLAVDNSPLISASQGTGSIPLSPLSTNSNTNSTQDHTNTIPSRQRSTWRNSSSSSNGGISHPPAQQGSANVTINNPSNRDHTHTRQSHGGVDNPSQRLNHKNRNGHHNHSVAKNFNGRDGILQRLPQRYPRHPNPHQPSPMSVPFIIPPQIPPFGGPMSFHDFQSPMYYPPTRGVPFYQPMPHPRAVAFEDLQLHSRIVNQIDYYFSNENLGKDVYLRQNMDDQGWVSINLIAGFKKVSCLTKNIHLILDALRNSMVVEVQGDKVRSRHNWMTWAPRDSIQLAQPEGNLVPDTLAAGVQNLPHDPSTSGWGQAGVGRVEASS